MYRTSQCSVTIKSRQRVLHRNHWRVVAKKIMCGTSQCSVTTKSRLWASNKDRKNIGIIPPSPSPSPQTRVEPIIWSGLVPLPPPPLSPPPNTLVPPPQWPIHIHGTHSRNCLVGLCKNRKPDMTAHEYDCWEPHDMLVHCFINGQWSSARSAWF